MLINAIKIVNSHTHTQDKIHMQKGTFACVLENPHMQRKINTCTEHFILVLLMPKHKVYLNLQSTGCL